MGIALAGTLAVLQTLAVAATSGVLVPPVPRLFPAVARGILGLGRNLSLTLPVAALCVVLGGWDVPTALGLYVANGVLGVTAICLALALAGASNDRASAAVHVCLLMLGATLVSWAAYAVMAPLDPWSRYAEWILYPNPAYGIVLFFSGDADAGSRVLWLRHFAALLGIAAAALGVALMRGRGVRKPTPS